MTTLSLYVFVSNGYAFIGLMMLQSMHAIWVGIVGFFWFSWFQLALFIHIGKWTPIVVGSAFIIVAIWFIIGIFLLWQIFVFFHKLYEFIINKWQNHKKNF
jgi:hypothetical protein